MRTKIVATIGPSSESKEMIEKFVTGGMDIARMNFSHCTEPEFLSRVKFVREAARKHKRTVKILQDLQGPRIRVGILPPEGVKLQEGKMVFFHTDAKPHADSIFIDHPHLHLDIRVGDPLYLMNGDLEVVVRRVAGTRMVTEVIRGGTLYSRKGVNVPRTKLSNSGLTAKDIKDVKFGLQHGADMVAISFVQTADDVMKLRKLVQATGGKAAKNVRIISKIETALALENIDAIIQASDDIMIARGDLGIEIPIEQVPAIQKNLIRHAGWYGKGTITATQMLLSMTDHARPTRAEVSDVANAVWDGTDAVMMSEESANGKYPLESLHMMRRIVAETEKLHFERPNPLAA